VILTLVRHATLVLEYGGRHLLVDPMLGDEGTAPPIEDSPNQRNNPLVPLPFPAAAASEPRILVPEDGEPLVLG
jgi:L-ascorbate metabolism protein UlaG (beta-lactamase superfamily)